MPEFVGATGSITPSLSDDNWTLDAGSGELGFITEVRWGGTSTTSEGMATRVQRSSGAAGAGTGGDVTEVDERGAANAIDYFTTYATTQPTLDAGELWGIGWNVLGGAIRFAHATGFPFANETVSCRNDAGTGASTYSCQWRE